jgi:ATPase subunit of ABC transporter with duplicated ATPase domains
MSGLYEVDIALHELAAGSKQLFETSENGSGLDPSSMSHLDCNLRLKKNRTYVLIGRNGCGKTTLLRAVASGKLEGLPQGLCVQLVDQDACVDEENETCSVMDIVLGVDTELRALGDEMETLCKIEDFDDAVGERMNEINDRIVELEEERRPAQKRAQEILRGLGFDKKTMDLSMPELSGGWRTRVMLAAALHMDPQLLLLDEPTNHLDIRAVSWLQDYLVKSFHGTVLCVSHDRAFINEIVDEIIVFTDNHSLKYHVGNLDDLHKFANKKATQCERKQQNQLKQILASEKKIEKLRRSVKRMKSHCPRIRVRKSMEISKGEAPQMLQPLSRRRTKGSSEKGKRLMGMEHLLSTRSVFKFRRARITAGLLASPRNFRMKIRR